MTIGEKRAILELILENQSCGGVRCNICPLFRPTVAEYRSCGVTKTTRLVDIANRTLVELAIEEMLEGKV